MITNVVAVNPVSLASEEDTQGQYRRGSRVRTEVETSWCSHLPRITWKHWTADKIALSLPEPMGQGVDLPTLLASLAGT